MKFNSQDSFCKIWRAVTCCLVILAATPLFGDDWLIQSRDFKVKVNHDKASQVLSLENGIARRTFFLGKDSVSTIQVVNESDQRNLVRAVRPEALITLDGKKFVVGGLTGQPNHAFLKPEWLKEMKPAANAFRLKAIQFPKVQARIAWKKVRHNDTSTHWPPKGKRVQFVFEHKDLPGIVVNVFYEMYDGVPVFCKWLTIENKTNRAVTLERVTTEILAVVEKSNWVEARNGVPVPRSDSIHVETDFAFGGFNHQNANRHVIHWQVDPQFSTQVNYLRKTPCLLKVEPTYGPAQTIKPGVTFKSYHTFELVYDSEDVQRRELALRKMYRTIAPWVTENPLMMHLKVSDEKSVRNAIDQCHDVGFEMVILSFGSGFNVEDRSEKNVVRWKELNAYAQSKKIELGGYSLLSSRRVGGGNNIVTPKGIRPTHNHCPALTSKWGQQYFETLYRFYEQTGFRLLEHDGSYPGDVDVTPRPPFQKGEADSRWAQWKVINKFYGWCREKGIYLNVPDYYYLNGSNKCGMGYREVNWSLPRDHQVLHTRQNIFDGTRSKTPSMGWMFVPLTQYHGGGAAATVEPLNEHLDHYELMMASNLGAGVQACFRGPRIYDTEKTKLRVKHWVDWYKKHRAILESDIIHSSSRRADGMDVDWILHANPELSEPGMLVVFNPLDREVTRSIPLNLYYTGISKAAMLTDMTGKSTRLKLDRRFKCQLKIVIPAKGVRAFSIKHSK